MTPLQLQRASLANVTRGDELPKLPEPAQRPSEFGNAFQDAMDSVDDAQKSANAEVEAFVAGEQENLHEVMIAMNQAQLSFQLMTEVRNRSLETYQELMRMQI